MTLPGRSSIPEIATAIAEFVDAQVAMREADLHAREAEIIRRAYRRGWRAGYFAGRRGAPAVTNPESRARGWVREALR
jgi:hypothetical protein